MDLDCVARNPRSRDACLYRPACFWLQTNVNAYAAEFLASNPTLDDFRAEVESCDHFLARIQAEIEPVMHIGVFELRCETFKVRTWLGMSERVAC